MEEATSSRRSQPTSRSQWWTEIIGALDELGRRQPETAPARADERSQTVHLASGERIALGPLLSNLVDCPSAFARGLILDYLETARSAAASVSLLTVGSWSAMAPRLGLVLRQPAADVIGRPVGPGLTLTPAIDANPGLIPVTRDLVRRWNQTAPAVVKAATANATNHPINIQPLDMRHWLPVDDYQLALPTAWVAIGGPFTAGRVLTLVSTGERFDATETLVAGLGDNALVLVPTDRHMASRSRFELARALQNLAVDLRGRMSIRPKDHSDAILLCRSDGQMAIFRIRG